jgi:hypothetical protein
MLSILKTFLALWLITLLLGVLALRLFAAEQPTQPVWVLTGLKLDFVAREAVLESRHVTTRQTRQLVFRGPRFLPWLRAIEPVIFDAPTPDATIDSPQEVDDGRRIGE